MNICVFTHTYPRFPQDPVAPFMRDFCLGLVENKQHVFLLAPYDPLFSRKQYFPKNLKLTLYQYFFPKRFHVLGYSQTLIGDQKLKFSVYLLAPFLFIFSFLALIKLVSKEKIDVISAHWILPNGFIAAIVSKITGVPLVVTIPGSDVYLGKKNFLFRWMTNFASSQAKIIASNSMRYLEELDIETHRAKFVEIPYGVNTNNFVHISQGKKEMRQLLKLSSSDLIILAVGRLVKKKGFDYLVKAMSAVAKGENRAKLVIIGDGEEKNALQKLTKQLGLEEKIYFPGRINHTDLPKYYAVADLYVAPSVKDVYGNLESHIVALFEAIASGLPIVATKLAVSKKYVIDGRNGYRVNDKDVKALSSAILRILGSDNLPNMGNVSRAIAQKYLSYQFCTKQYVKIFNKITSVSPKQLF